MNKQVGLLNKILVIGINILLIIIAVQPSIAVVQPGEKRDIESKGYLFQTIIDIADNPEVKNLLGQNRNNLFKIDIDRSIFKNIFLRNPRFFHSLIFTKPSMNQGYLDKCYYKGIGIINILGEDKALEIIDSIKFNNIKIFNNLNIIIKNDKELFSRIASIQEMNKELKSNSPFKGDPLICYITLIFLFPILLLVELTEMNNIIGWIFALITSPFMIFLDIIGLVLYALGENLGC
jgi:hypothetical protein